jgi:hypothetical protein
VLSDRQDFDAVLLAQYSLSPAADTLSRALGEAVLAGPKLAAATLRAQLLGDQTNADTKGREVSCWLPAGS